MKSTVKWDQRGKRKGFRRAGHTDRHLHMVVVISLKLGSLSLGKLGEFQGPNHQWPKVHTLRGVLWVLNRANGYREGEREPTVTSCHPGRLVTALPSHRECNWDTNNHKDWAKILTLLFIGCITLDKILDVSQISSKNEAVRRIKYW